MPRGRSPNREKALELWKKSDGKRLLRDIAEELGVSEAMVRKWKNQDGWESAALPNEPETLPNENLPQKEHQKETATLPATAHPQATKTVMYTACTPIRRSI